jgi:hypothetical protein
VVMVNEPGWVKVWGGAVERTISETQLDW